MKEKDSLLMLKYMVSEGFNPEDYERILEVLQSAPCSISKELTYLDNTYLLSKNVRYDELDRYGIDGAYGYLEDKNIFVPKTLFNDERFLNNSIKTLFPKYGYGVPTIDEFKTIIFYHEGNLLDSELFNAIKNSYLVEDKYFGFVTEKDTKRKNSDLMLLKEYLKKINLSSSKEHVLTHETISEKNKELYLIKRK